MKKLFLLALPLLLITQPAHSINVSTLKLVRTLLCTVGAGVIAAGTLGDIMTQKCKAWRSAEYITMSTGVAAGSVVYEDIPLLYAQYQTWRNQKDNQKPVHSIRFSTPLKVVRAIICTVSISSIARFVFKEITKAPETSSSIEKIISIRRIKGPEKSGHESLKLVGLGMIIGVPIGSIAYEDISSLYAQYKTWRNQKNEKHSQ